jgi:16S rRNA processing protein RimM
LVLKFEGIGSISDAEPLIGAEIQIPKEERAELETGSAYVADLVGCRVFASCHRPTTADLACEIGVVSDVLFGAGEAPLLAIHDGKKEHLVPFAQEYIKSLDIAAKRIELELPEGMLDLDAPLSEEDKNVQKNSDS